MILHTVNKSTPQQALDLCLRFAATGDILVLLEDGAYNAVAASAASARLQAAKLSRIAVIQADLAARGLEGKQSPTIELIDYQTLVTLCCECDKVQSWF
jgi:tRNA 2-thiouridine synthesizing protein B